MMNYTEQVKKKRIFHELMLLEFISGKQQGDTKFRQIPNDKIIKNGITKLTYAFYADFNQ